MIKMHWIVFKAFPDIKNVQLLFGDRFVNDNRFMGLGTRVDDPSEISPKLSVLFWVHFTRIINHARNVKTKNAFAQIIDFLDLLFRGLGAIFGDRSGSSKLTACCKGVPWAAFVMLFLAQLLSAWNHDRSETSKWRLLHFHLTLKDQKQKSPKMCPNNDLYVGHYWSPKGELKMYRMVLRNWNMTLPLQWPRPFSVVGTQSE